MRSACTGVPYSIPVPVSSPPPPPTRRRRKGSWKETLPAPPAPPSRYVSLHEAMGSNESPLSTTTKSRTCISTLTETRKFQNSIFNSSSFHRSGSNSPPPAPLLFYSKHKKQKRKQKPHGARRGISKAHKHPPKTPKPDPKTNIKNALANPTQPYRKQNRKTKAPKIN